MGIGCEKYVAPSLGIWIESEKHVNKPNLSLILRYSYENSLKIPRVNRMKLLNPWLYNCAWSGNWDAPSLGNWNDNEKLVIK